MTSVSASDQSSCRVAIADLPSFCVSTSDQSTICRFLRLSVSASNVGPVPLPFLSLLCNAPDRTETSKKGDLTTTTSAQPKNLGDGTTSGKSISIIPSHGTSESPYGKNPQQVATEIYRVISGHLGWVRSIAFDPRLAMSTRHTCMFSVGDDKLDKCWDLEQNKVIRSYHGHLSGVYCLALHPIIDVLLTDGRDSVCGAVKLEDGGKTTREIDQENMSTGQRDALLLFRTLCKGLLEGVSHSFTNNFNIIDSVKAYLSYVLLRDSISQSLFQYATGIFALFLLHFICNVPDCRFTWHFILYGFQIATTTTKSSDNDHVTTTTSESSDNHHRPELPWLEELLSLRILAAATNPCCVLENARFLKMGYSPSSSSSSQFNVAAVLKTSSFLFFIFVSYGRYCLLLGASAVTFTFVNECGFTVWPGILEFVGSRGFNSTGFELTKGNSRSFQAPAVWEGRFWGRTGCNFSVPGNGSCATGDCGTGAIDCNGSGYMPPATFVEFTINRTHGSDLYDVSIVDGYNLPILVEAIGGSGSGLRSCAKC
ncbi:hypothetical protein LXL04_029214 [Taraxacum kok-saghyz]